MRATVLLLLLSGACDDSSSANFANGCSGDYDKMMGALCDLLSRCPDVYPLAYSDRDQCKAILCWATTCRLDSTGSGRDRVYTVAQMVPALDPSGEQACLDWLGSVTCDQAKLQFTGDANSMAGTPCDHAFSGSSSSSSSNGSTECDSQSCDKGKYCKYGSVNVDLGVRTCATCLPLPTMGQPCQGQCAEGLYCDDHFNTSTFTCVAQLADGSACYESGINQPCQSGFCNFRTNLCDPNGKEGDACTSDYDCRENHCNASQICAKLHANGDACTADADCANNKCDPTAHVCGLATGSACQQFNDFCLGYCDTTTNTCAAPKSLGASCQQAKECSSGFCTQLSFSSSAEVCALRCDSTTPCPSGQTCGTFGACVSPLGDGAECDHDSDCQSGYCNSSGHCGTRPALGAACGDTSDCAPIGYCSGGTCQKQKSPGQACDSYDSCLAPYICLNKSCVPMNLSCAPASAGQMCAYLRVCDDQSYCDLLGSFTCKPRFSSGQPCTSNEECAKDLYCSSGTCAARNAAGASCMSNSECTSGNYCVKANNSSSSSMGTCTAGPAGQPCDQYDGPFCPDGYSCPGSDSACVAGTAQKGESCTSFSGPFCVAGLYCDGSTCKEKNPIGGSCSFSDDACAPGGHCDPKVDLCLLSAECVPQM